ncbi:hypothetical protein [Nocardia niigatensis]|uniref:hypothetical protein n=1 Tax=Nocardia niigatensis TaxID=209249 RepID=UPI0002E9AD56|nr:hypothetical protein [Nocardia niigatensis]
MPRTSRLLGAALTAAALLAGTGVSAATATAAPVFAAARTATPGTGDLKAKLQTALDTGAPAATRAAELEAGEAGLPLLDQVGTAMNAAPPSFRWSILGPVTEDGDTLSATLQTAVDGFDPFTFPLTWKLIDGNWKLSRDAECTVASVAMLPCSL